MNNPKLAKAKLKVKQCNQQKCPDVAALVADQEAETQKHMSGLLTQLMLKKIDKVQFIKKSYAWMSKMVKSKTTKLISECNINKCNKLVLQAIKFSLEMPEQLCKNMDNASCKMVNDVKLLINNEKSLTMEKYMKIQDIMMSHLQK